MLRLRLRREAGAGAWHGSRDGGDGHLEDALEIARRSAEGLPITYRRLDLNRDELEPGRYDFVVSAAGLHHVTNLEHCVHQLWRSLKPGGLLLMNEFVGPDRFQWTDEQLEEMNRLFVPLPVEKRHNLMTGVTSERIERRPLAYMIEADPSEAVRSSEIIGTVSLFFEPFVVREFGGTVLHPMLEGIAATSTWRTRKTALWYAPLSSRGEARVERRAPGRFPDTGRQEEGRGAGRRGGAFERGQ